MNIGTCFMKRVGPFLIVVFAAILLLSCSRPPSNEEMKTLITDYEAVRTTGLQSISVEIKEKGKFNKNYHYWPVKARVQIEKRSFDGSTIRRDIISSFKFRKDDYGKWQVWK